MGHQPFPMTHKLRRPPHTSSTLDVSPLSKLTKDVHARQIFCRMLARALPRRTRTMLLGVSPHQLSKPSNFLTRVLSYNLLGDLVSVSRESLSTLPACLTVLVSDTTLPRSPFCCEDPRHPQRVFAMLILPSEASRPLLVQRHKHFRKLPNLAGGCHCVHPP